MARPPTLDAIAGAGEIGPYPGEIVAEVVPVVRQGKIDPASGVVWREGGDGACSGRAPWSGWRSPSARA